MFWCASVTYQTRRQMCFDSGGLQMSERVTGCVSRLRRNPSRGAGTSSICSRRATTDWNSLSRATSTGGRRRTPSTAAARCRRRRRRSAGWKSEATACSIPSFFFFYPFQRTCTYFPLSVSSWFSTWERFFFLCLFCAKPSLTKGEERLDRTACRIDASQSQTGHLAARKVCATVLQTSVVMYST